MGIVLCVVGILAGGSIAYFLAKRSDRNTADRLGVVERCLIAHDGLLREALGHLTQRAPEIAAELTKKLQKVETNEAVRAPASRSRDRVGMHGNVWDGDRCPACKDGRFYWSHWGPGPFGSFTAWYECNECGQELPNQEVFGA